MSTDPMLEERNELAAALTKCDEFFRSLMFCRNDEEIVAYLREAREPTHGLVQRALGHGHLGSASKLS